MGLDVYRKKRRFDKTPEPSGDAKGAKRAGAKLAYAIQKHRASRLHYDLRLEWNGVLLSWAIPKGPSFDPSVKRLARQTEDHPLDYAGFEGVIPEKEYGGGTVMVWDRGTWTPEVQEVAAAIAKGDLKFTIDGEKLHGSWVLVRIKSWDKKDDQGNWLLIKHKDAFASTEDVTLAKPWSVVTARSLRQIAEQEGGNVAKAADGDPPPPGRDSHPGPGPVTPPAAKPKRAAPAPERRPPPASGTGSRGSAAAPRGSATRTGSAARPARRRPKSK
jgi:bifunctional non-homologous end joining protein LigD